MPTKTSEEKTSEYGKGFVYNIFLFTKHFEKFIQYMKKNNERYKGPLEKGKDDLWFNGAGDHFFEFQVPEQFKNTEIERLALQLQDEAIERRLGSTTIDEFHDFFRRLEQLCLLIDKELGVAPIKATWN